MYGVEEVFVNFSSKRGKNNFLDEAVAYYLRASRILWNSL